MSDPAIALGPDVEVRTFKIRGTRVHASAPGHHGTGLDNWTVYSPTTEDGQSVRVEQAPDLAGALTLARQRGAEDAPAYAKHMAEWHQPVESYVPPPDEDPIDRLTRERDEARRVAVLDRKPLSGAEHAEMRALVDRAKQEGWLK